MRQAPLSPQEGGHKEPDADCKIIEAALASGAIPTKHTDPAFENTRTPYTIKPPEGYLKMKRKGHITDPPSRSVRLGEQTRAGTLRTFKYRAHTPV